MRTHLMLVTLFLIMKLRYSQSRCEEPGSRRSASDVGFLAPNEQADIPTLPAFNRNWFLFYFLLLKAAAEQRFGHPQADHSEEVQRFGLWQLCGSDGQKKCGWVFFRMTNVVHWIHSWVRCTNDDNITSINVNDNKLKKQKMVIYSVELILAHYYIWSSGFLSPKCSFNFCFTKLLCPSFDFISCPSDADPVQPPQKSKTSAI